MHESRVMHMGSRLAVVAFVAMATALTGAGQGRGGGFGGGFGAEQALVEQFDTDGNGRLDVDERRAARASRSGGQGRGGFGFGGRRGFGAGGFAETSPGVRLQPDDVEVFGDEPLYDPAVLRTIFLEFENDDWEDELAAFYNTDVEVPAIVMVDGRTYPEVGVHFRGATSFLMVPEGSKRSLNLSFDFVNEDQRLLGYRTLNLLNAAGDPTFVRAVFYSHVARQYLPTPKMNYVRVVVNGESWGVYVSAEQFNTDFTRDWYGSTTGARWRVPGSPNGRGGMEYLGDDVDAYRGIYDIRSRDREESWADLIEMYRVLDEMPIELLESRLAPLLDIDGVLRFLAVELALVNSDGYWARASDYSIYEDDQGQFHVVPHDVNEALTDDGVPGGGRGRGGRGNGGRGAGRGAGRGFGMLALVGTDLDPLVGLDDASKPLRSKLLAVPALRERYLTYVREIAENWLDWEAMEPLLRGYQALIAEEVRRDTRKLFSTDAFTNALDGETDSLKGFLDARRAFLLGVLP